MTDTLGAKLAAEFPKNQIHWRAQTLTRNGDKALALAYLDARDVMDRLDDVCGPENWQYEISETPKGRVIGRIGINVNAHFAVKSDDGLEPAPERWVWKSDGAGDTAVEGEKGGISDAFKRAAVHWGIGRYLYRLGAVWAPCKTYQGNDGKARFSEWIGSPWEHVKETGPAPRDATQTEIETAMDKIASCESMDELGAYWHELNKNAHHVAADPDVIEAKNKRKEQLT